VRRQSPEGVSKPHLIGIAIRIRLEVVSKSQIAFESKAQADAKAQHTL
jgi:hypothetical protein